jgi:hypothetical protein
LVGVAKRKMPHVRWDTGVFAVFIGLTGAAAWFVVSITVFGGAPRDIGWIEIALVAVAAALISGRLLWLGRWSWGRFGGHMGLALLGFFGVFALFIAIIYAPIAIWGCGGTFVHEAHWTDRDLFAALNAPVTPPRGMAVDVEDVALMSIQMPPLAYGNGILFATITVDENETVVENATRRFLQIATHLDAAKIEERVEAMMQSRGPTSYRNVPPASPDVQYMLEQSIDTERFIAWLGAKESLAPIVARDNVTAHFSSATKHIVLDGHDIVVDGWGAAQMRYDWGEMSDDAVLADVQEVLQRHGLPAPRSVEIVAAVVSC